MSELLFFILGFIIGSLSGITLLCFLVIGKQFSGDEELTPIETKEIICEKEKQKNNFG